MAVSEVFSNAGKHSRTYLSIEPNGIHEEADLQAEGGSIRSRG
jgi:hypothetical protein